MSQQKPSSATDDSTTLDEKVGHKQRKASDPDFEDKIELTEDAAHDKTGFAFPPWKKWSIISVIFVIQCSMNFNASVYANAVDGLIEEFHISGQAARVGQCVFLIAYGFGCELWAPWSEEVCVTPPELGSASPSSTVY